jgi:HTH-type transcriptional regulator/antitoxin HipB
MRQVLTIPNQVGSVLRGRRKALDLSQEKLAAKLGIAQNRLSQLESDPSRLTLDRLLALINVLGLELVVQVKENPSNHQGEW